MDWRALVLMVLSLVLIKPGKSNVLVAFVGETVSMRCKVTTSYVQFVWIKEETTMASGPPDEVKSERTRVTLSNPQAGVRELTINDVRTYDEGYYLCIVTLINGTRLTYSSTVQVQSQLSIESTPRADQNQQTSGLLIEDSDIVIPKTTSKATGNIVPKEVFAGDTLILPCPVLSSSSKFIWQKNGVPMAYGPPDTVLIEEKRISISDSTYGWRKLIIKYVSVADSGRYLCVVDQGFGSPFQMTTEVRVLKEGDTGTTESSDVQTTQGPFSSALPISHKVTTYETMTYDVHTRTPSFSTIRTSLKGNELNNPSNICGDLVLSKYTLTGLVIIANIIRNL
ncbi:uncharacterized protein LOC133182096 [Saccostrea echinata]|uniref:uncharacterized protein LOC133182096 n=1 Tax=Saccostrea echinata TaxID=191078 RepID=UPI002A803042|nr:uncharacterized protein LOC133182096 [Saccostrea echinata]